MQRETRIAATAQAVLQQRGPVAQRDAGIGRTERSSSIEVPSSTSDGVMPKSAATST